MSDLSGLPQIKYGVFIGEEKEGETRILRHPLIGEGPLKDENKFKYKTIWEAMEGNLKKGRGNHPFLGTRIKLPNGELDNKYTFKTYQEIYDLAIDFAKGISVLNLTPEFKTKINGTHKFLGLYSKNREEWVITDLACQANSCSTVTIYDTLGDEAVEFILKETQIISMVIEKNNLKKILKLSKEGKVGCLKNLIVLDKIDPDEAKAFNEIGMTLYHFNDIINKGKPEKIEFTPANAETIVTVCYTSGTTGLPKGVLLSHRSFMTMMDFLDSAEFEVNSSDLYLSFLPLAHNMERLIFSVIITHGATIGFYCGDARKVVEDAKLLKPTCVCGVPRIFHRIYDTIMQNVSKLGGFQRRLFDKAVKDKLEQFEHTRNVHHVFWDFVVFKKIRAVLGGRVRFMLTGSAPMSAKILNFLKIAFSVDMFEGYGQTENCSGMLITRSYDPVAGHLGGCGFANEAKLVDVKDLGYTSKDINPETGVPEPRGEIWLRGPSIFSGYLNDEEKTKESLDDDNWFHTGDIGAILTGHGNAIKIIDRIKNIFKLSQGEFVAPEKLENVLVRSEYVQQICICGDPFQNYIVAILVPQISKCIEFLKSQGIDANKDNVFDYYDNEKLKSDILKNLETLGRSNDFKGFEIIKKIYLSKEPFSIENDLLTPTLKAKRNNVKRRYAKEIKEMYDNIKK